MWGLCILDSMGISLEKVQLLFFLRDGIGLRVRGLGFKSLGVWGFGG